MTSKIILSSLALILVLGLLALSVVGVPSPMAEIRKELPTEQFLK